MLVLIILGLIAYALASLFGLCRVLSRKHFFTKWALISVLTGFGVLTLMLILLMKDFFTASLSRDIYLFIFAWLFSVVSIVFWKKLKNPFLLLISSPLFFLLLHTAMLALNSFTPISESFTGIFFYTHITALFFSIIFILIGGIAGVLFLLQDRAMKHKNQIHNFQSLFPSLESLDKVNYLAVIWGFPLYTLGLICGFIWASTAWESVFSGDIKEIISLIVWLMFALLFHMRLALGLRGKKPAYIMIALCIISLFSLIVVNSLFMTHHNFWNN